MAMTLITTNTSSNAATSAFTSSIDSTYKLYIFKFIDVNPETDDVHFQFQASTDGGSSYGLTITSTMFYAEHGESDSPAGGFTYHTGGDLAQSTSDQQLARNCGGGSDESFAGTLWLFNPSNTTYVKHFYATITQLHSSDRQVPRYIAGYFNTTSDIDAVIFRCSADNFDGTIKMYGVG